ncbi:hypothetical protein HAX54_038943 [Datura stramonium]|uniref:Uncharacterized protein n=1 Tax=Datura stramonium TaxID=4076 RepID=A0ABS8VM60_DATST|nr:hypothetical protein [Datura stramonium]
MEDMRNSAFWGFTETQSVFGVGKMGLTEVSTVFRRLHKNWPTNGKTFKWTLEAIYNASDLNDELLHFSSQTRIESVEIRSRCIACKKGSHAFSIELQSPECRSLIELNADDIEYVYRRSVALFGISALPVCFSFAIVFISEECQRCDG